MQPYEFAAIVLPRQPESFKLIIEDVRRNRRNRSNSARHDGPPTREEWTMGLKSKIKKLLGKGKKADKVSDKQVEEAGQKLTDYQLRLQDYQLFEQRSQRLQARFNAMAKVGIDQDDIAPITTDVIKLRDDFRDWLGAVRELYGGWEAVGSDAFADTFGLTTVKQSSEKWMALINKADHFHRILDEVANGMQKMAA